MALLNITAASRAAGVNRSTIVRAMKSGRLSTTTDDAGERCIDTAELMRVFGGLKGDAYADAQAAPMHATGDAHPVAQERSILVEILQEQLRQAHEREREGREREARLLAMLENEQQTRRELETKLLPAPAPRPAPPGKGRVWALVILLLATLAFAGWRFREVIVAALAP